MKGLLGRKVGMTSVFTEHGKNIPVTVIEVQPNTVTNILTKEKHGYNAVQLAVFDRRDKTSTKPLLGHFKKANTSAKRFIKEIRGMESEKLGDLIDLSIFAPGQLVDVTGTSKGKGFQGNIKRHNQKIGPKSHGGGGGSKPVRQVGSLGDMVSNRVFKGMTMPGHMGAAKTTAQNLEVVSIDIENNIILIKGSIPGPNKGFVIIKDAVKGLPNKEIIKLVNVKEASQKNELLEVAKKYHLDINTDMSLEEMQSAVAEAKAAKKAKKEAEKAQKHANKDKETQKPEEESKDTNEVVNSEVVKKDSSKEGGEA